MNFIVKWKDDRRDVCTYFLLDGIIYDGHKARYMMYRLYFENNLITIVPSEDVIDIEEIQAPEKSSVDIVMVYESFSILMGIFKDRGFNIEYSAITIESRQQFNNYINSFMNYTDFNLAK